MQRASDERLQRRTILKASRLSSPQKSGISRADTATLRQRKLVRANRSSFGSPVSPPPAATSSPLRNASSVPDSTPPKSPGRPADEEVALEVRAKLFAKVDSSWAMRGKGSLRCCVTADTKSIKLLDVQKGEIEIRAWRHRTKVIKESSKGKATYVRCSAVIDALKGEEALLIQVRPELLHRLYCALE